MNNSKIIKRLRPTHLIGVLTILGAGCAVVLSFLRVIDLTRAEEIIITLLCLIAADALIERLFVLQKIESKLDKEKSVLKGREDIITPDKMAKNAKSIYVLAISACSIGIPYVNFYENKLREGCNIKFILLSPSSKYLNAVDIQNLDKIQTKPHIDAALEALRPLAKRRNYRGKFEIRLSDVFFPFSIVGADLEKNTGKMTVEYHCYKVPLDSRPHIFLEKEKDQFWFNFYQNQFELAWADAKRI